MTQRLNQAGWRSRSWGKGSSASNGRKAAKLSHQLPLLPLARSKGLGLSAREGQGPATPSLPAVHGASDLGRPKVLRVRPLAQARFLRGESSGTLGTWKAWVWPVPQGWGGRGEGTGRALSCGPGDGRAVLLGLHAEGSDARGLAVWLAVELVAIEAWAEARCSKQATHVRLAHVAASPRDTQEVGDTAGSRARGVRVRGHAGWHWVTGDHAGWHWRGSPIVANPGWVLNLGRGEGEMSRAGWGGGRGVHEGLPLTPD